MIVVNVACYKAAALLPNGENAHITVRGPTWWKGVFDTISSKYEDIEVMLICSQNFNKGVIFDPFKFSDWDSVKGYTTNAGYKIFEPKNNSDFFVNRAKKLYTVLEKKLKSTSLICLKKQFFFGSCIFQTKSGGSYVS